MIHDKTNLRGARAFQIEGGKWKTIEKYDTLENGNVDVYWAGWKTDLRRLSNYGWLITRVTNHFNGKQKLYVRDPVKKLMGRGNIIKDAGYRDEAHNKQEVYLDYFMHEKNQRIKKFIQNVDAENIIVINEENMGIVLEHIADLQRKSAKPKKRPSRDPAEILQYIKIAS